MKHRNNEKILKALANGRRLEIIKYIKGKKKANVGDIASHIKLSFKSTSRHLSILLGADMLEKEQKNVLVFYSISTKLAPLAKLVIFQI